MSVRAARLLLLSSALGVVVLALGCGPSVGEARLISAPARPATCDLDFLELEMQDMVPGAKYEILGHVMLAEHGVRDPLAPEYRREVRPRACAMGGEAVAILMSAGNAPQAFSLGGTTIDYAVLRKRTARQQKGPSKF